MRHPVTCPVCGSKGNCIPHASYQRSLIEFRGGEAVYGKIEIKRLRCTSCAHTHALLPDFIIPYTTYSLCFVLRVLAAYFIRSRTVEQICSRYSITPSMLYQWKALFLSQKDIWLGLLPSSETSPSAFLLQLFVLPSYACSFAWPFFAKTAGSFLQRRPDTAISRHAVFEPGGIFG